MSVKMNSRKSFVSFLVVPAILALIKGMGLCEFEELDQRNAAEKNKVVNTILPCSNDTFKNNCTCNRSTMEDEPHFCYCMDIFAPTKQCEWFPNDCYQLRHRGFVNSGIFTIQTLDYLRINTSCDMTTDGGGWTVFQRRVNGSVQFDRGWNDYKEGLGKENFEFWLGNENLHQLTKQKRYELRIYIITMSGESFYATYDNFTVGGEAEYYRLESLGEFSGTKGLVDAMSCHEAMFFTTKDNDNDRSKGNCASASSSGWWFNGGSEERPCPNNYCKQANLNGVYGTDSNQYGILWHSKRGLVFTEMKIRPHQEDM